MRMMELACSTLPICCSVAPMAPYGPGKPHSFLADQQNKNSGSYHHCNQNTDDERRNRMATGFDLFRSSALLHRSDAQPEEKFIHQVIPRSSRPKEQPTHRSLDKDAPLSRPIQRTGSIVSHALLGGLHHHYVRV